MNYSFSHIESHIKQEHNLNITEEDYNFYLFQIHDLDNNNRLDGLEILKMFSHDFLLEEKYSDNNMVNNTNITDNTYNDSNIETSDQTENDGILDKEDVKSEKPTVNSSEESLSESNGNISESNYIQEVENDMIEDLDIANIHVNQLEENVIKEEEISRISNPILDYTLEDFAGIYNFY